MNRYFDNAAAVPPSPTVLSRLTELALQFPGNQEASGAMGETAKQAVRAAESDLLDRICGRFAREHQVLWVHTGTDAVRSGVRLLADANPKGGRILCTEGEHASVLAALDDLPPRFEAVRVSLRRDGSIDPDDLRRKCEEASPVFAAFHWVQSETGAVQDVSALRGILSKSGVPMLLDAIQGIGKLDFPFEAARPEMTTISGQKIGAPSGAALILHRRHAGAARALRSVRHAVGRVPPAFCLLLAELAKKGPAALSCDCRRILLAALNERIPDQFRETIPAATASPWILHLTFRKCQGVHLTRALARWGFSIAAGSACDAETDRPSRVLSAMGFRKEDAHRGVRISFSPEHEPGDLDALADALARATAEY